MTEQSYSTQLAQFLPTASGGEPTMSSVEIAELTGKKHQHVMRDIRAALEGLSKSGQPFEGTYINAQGRAQPCFNLPKRECLILVSGYSIDLRAKIIDRWMELEQGEAAPATIDFSSPRVVLGVLSALQSQLGEKDQIIADLGEKAKHLERIEGAYGSMCLTDAAKTLKKGPQELIRFMNTRDWIYKRVGNSSWVGRQAKIGSGYLEHREHVYTDRYGVQRVATRVLVTGKGLVKLAEMLEAPLH